MSKVLITRSKLDGLATTIAAKSGATLPLTIAQMDTAVQNMSGGGTEAGTVTQDANGFLVLDDDPPAGPTLITKSITANGTYNASSDSADGYSSVTVNVSGGGGLVYETGTWEPSSDVTQANITFANQHITRPFYVMICDTTDTAVANDSCLCWTVYSWYDAFSATEPAGVTTQYYARVQHNSLSGSSYSAGGSNVSALTGTGNSALSTHLTNEHFTPFCNATRYWRAGRTYKWIAVWAPTS